MRIYQLTSPQNNAIELAEVKAHLRVDYDEEDDMIAGLIDAATLQCEKYQNRTYINQNLKVTFDDLIKCINIPRPPLISINSVKLNLEDGSQVVVDSDDYLYDPGAHQSKFYFSGFDDYIGYTLKERNGFEIELTAGYGELTTDIPSDIKLAIKLLVGHWHQNRETSSRLRVNEIPYGVYSILSKDRIKNV